MRSSYQARIQSLSLAVSCASSASSELAIPPLCGYFTLSPDFYDYLHFDVHIFRLVNRLNTLLEFIRNFYVDLQWYPHYCLFFFFFHFTLWRTEVTRWLLHSAHLHIYNLFQFRGCLKVIELNVRILLHIGTVIITVKIYWIFSIISVKKWL